MAFSENNNSTSNIETFVPPQKPDSIDKEKAIIKHLERETSDLKLGETFYVISSKWLRNWKNNDIPNPGSINNEFLLEENSDKIKRNCLENYDFSIISKEIWITLQSWYGGGPSLPRKVIYHKNGSNNLIVEIRPLFLRVYTSSNLDFINVSVSMSTTLQKFKEDICNRFSLNHEFVKVWLYINSY